MYIQEMQLTLPIENTTVDMQVWEIPWLATPAMYNFAVIDICLNL